MTAARQDQAEVDREGFQDSDPSAVLLGAVAAFDFAPDTFALPLVLLFVVSVVSAAGVAWLVVRGIQLLAHRAEEGVSGPTAKGGPGPA